MQATGTASIESGASLNLKAGGNASLEGSGTASVKGSVIKLNNGSQAAIGANAIVVGNQVQPRQTTVLIPLLESRRP